MAEQWWSKRFVAVLESFGLGGRMQRGRRYARMGQVLDLTVEAGVVTGHVQGSRAKPYVVRIAMAVPTVEQWGEIETAMAARAGFIAHLLAGEVPPELEAVFEDAGVSLFPRTWTGLTANCSCPDWGNPCKHLAAVLYVLADQLDADPWRLLAWRGRAREDLLETLLGSGASTGTGRDPRLPPWWPLAVAPVPDTAGERSLPTLDAEPADPPDAALARFGSIGLDVAGLPVEALLAGVYQALAEPGPDEPPGVRR